MSDVSGVAPMNIRTIIHIGQHRTGTTSIQHYLRNRRAELARRGLYVPDSIVGYDNPSHFILNVYSLNPNRLSSMKEQLLASRPPGYFTRLHELLEEDIANHYRNAESQQCKDVVWSNEGLYLLNSTEEYERLVHLFDKHSSEIVCICCFREIESYKTSYANHLKRRGIDLSDDRDSYRYLDADSWLFDYKGKEEMLRKVFDRVICFPYSKDNMVRSFMDQLGYPVTDGDSIRLNASESV